MLRCCASLVSVSEEANKQSHMQNGPDSVREAYRIAWQQWQSEADRFWTRNTTFLALQSAILAILALALGQGVGPMPAVVVLGSIFGFAVAWAWKSVIARSDDYLKEWAGVILDLENKYQPVIVPLMQTYFAVRDEPNKDSRLKNRIAEGTHRTSWILVSAWGALALVSAAWWIWTVYAGT